jgi:hypothetical protein
LFGGNSGRVFGDLQIVRSNWEKWEGLHYVFGLGVVAQKLYVVNCGLAS